MKSMFSLFAALALQASATLCAASTVVTVDGRSGPWDVALNPGYDYGVPVNGVPNSNLGPTVVVASVDLPLTPGDILNLAYLDGRALFGAGGTAWAEDGNGVAWWPGDSRAPGNPAWYTSGSDVVRLGTLMGTFASAGVIVGVPFIIGNGPLELVIPGGAGTLQLGFTDGWYNDNGIDPAHPFRVSISETVVPLPSALPLMLAAFSSLSVVSIRRRYR